MPAAGFPVHANGADDEDPARFGIGGGDGSGGASAGSGPNGGAGGDAAGLEPIPCDTPGACSNAGPGGGGGGGYFGGGGGATGFNVCSGTNGPCGNITASLGGGAGSSFIGNSVLYPGPTIIGGLGTGVP